MSLKNFLNESLKYNDTKFDGFVNDDFIGESSEINEAKKNYDNFTIEQVKKLSSHGFAKSNKMSDILLNSNSGVFTGTVWYKNWKIRKYQGSLQILDVTNAMKRGKDIPKITLFAEMGMNEFNVTLYNYMESIKKGLTFEDFMRLIVPALLDSGENLYLDKNGEYSQTDYVTSISVHKDDNYKKGVQVFAPHIVPNIKPLKVMPKKWKVSDLIKVIATNQYSYLGRDYKYTDDYSYDAAYNYAKTDKLNPIDMIERFIENPNWYNHIWKRGGVETDVEGKIETLNFGSSNESFTIVVNLDNPPTDAKTVVKRFETK